MSMTLQDDRHAQQKAEEQGRLIKEWRLDLGLNRPEMVSEMARHGAEMTTDYLAKIEHGTSPLAAVALSKREGMRHVLRKSAEEWTAAIGLYTRAVEIPYPPAELEENDRMIRVPLLGTVSAGEDEPHPLEGEFTGVPEKTLLRKRANRKNVFGYIVNGTSMLSDGVRDKRSLQHGDVIAVERYRIARDEDMVVAWDAREEKMLVKLVIEEEDWLIFKSLSSNYAPLMRRPEEVHIFGVVIWRGGDT